jgi:hypothetical protein
MGAGCCGVGSQNMHTKRNIIKKQKEGKKEDEKIEIDMEDKKGAAITCYLDASSQSLLIYHIYEKRKTELNLKKSSSYGNEEAALVIVLDKIFLIGGKSSKNEYLKSTILILDQCQIVKKASMKMQRSNFPACLIGSQFIIACGGFTGTTSIKDCEKYDVFQNSWSDFPPLQKARGESALSAFKEKYVYCFGGSGADNHLYEFIDCSKENTKWELIKFAHSESEEDSWKTRAFANAFQISELTLLIFGGGYSKDSFVFNSEDNSIVKHSPLKKISNFQNSFISPVLLDKEVISVDEDANIHIYSITNKTWNIIRDREWKK